MKNYVLAVSKLSKSIKGHLILDNTSLKAKAGEICGVTGRNASGKSMLFKCIANIVVPTSGTIEIFGRPVNKLFQGTENIGVLIERPGFIESLSGYKNLKLLAGIRSIICDEEIYTIMESLGLNPGDKRACKKYSLGMLQKLGIAAALMENPDLVLLDEPTNNVDAESVEMILNLLIRYKKAGTTILLTSHHRDEIDRIADTIYCIDEGRIHRE